MTHDYLVPALRKWLTRKQQETRAGRAELRLAERAALWNAKPQNRHLPSIVEWASIRGLTDSKRWTGPQRAMMRKAGRVHATRTALVLAGLLAVLFAGITIRNTIERNRLELVAQKQEERNDAEATRLVDGLLQADTSQVKTIIGDLADYRQWARDDLQRAYSESPEDSNARLHAALAMLPEDQSVLPFLKERLLTVTPTQFEHVRDLLETRKAELNADYWKIATDDGQAPDRRFQAACALAGFDPENEHWRDGAFTQFIAGHLCGVLPSELAPWRNALRGVKGRLVDPLSNIFRDDSARQQVRSFATETLADYVNDDPETLAALVVDADAEAFKTLFPLLEKHRQAGITQMKTVLDRKLRPDWNDGPLDASWTNPSADAKATIEAAHGIIGERFAFCQDLPWDEFSGLAEKLSRSGYRPTKVRPYWRGAGQVHGGAEEAMSDREAPAANSVAKTPATLLVAAVWTRDGKRWELQSGLTKDDLPDPNSPATRNGLLPVDLAVFPAPPTTRRPPRFTILWGEPAGKDEERRLIVDLSREQIAVHETSEGFYTSHLAKQGFASQSVIAVWTDENGVRQYGGIWSNRGAPSEINPAYPGFELVDQPQWDVAAAKAGKQPDPLDGYRRLMAQIEALPGERLDAPPVRLARARAQFHLGRFEAALADLDFLIQNQKPVPAEVLHLRAWTLARMKRSNEAREVLAKFLERDEASDQGYVQIVTLAWLNEHDKATAKLDEFVAAAGRYSGKLYDAACAAALAAQPFSDTDAPRAAKYTERALKLLESAVAHGYSDAEHMGSDVDLAGLHGDRRFTALLQILLLQPPARYAAVWRADVAVESKLLTLDRNGSLQDVETLITEDFRPVAVAATASETKLILHRPLIPDNAKEQLARQQATAATALLRMDAAEPVWQLFQHQNDPRLRSYLLHRLVPYGADPATIIERLESEREVSRRRALILAIGEFARAKLLNTEQTAAATEVLARWYADDVDSGIHGACEWTLRRLGADDAINKVQQAYAKGKVVGGRQWYLTKTGRQTFVLVDARGEFLMGSPVSEAERIQGPTGRNEIRHRRRIGRRFAIGAHEVTVAQFQQFREDHSFDRTTARESDAPANRISWYDAAAYCNWLSAQEGIPREQWCYDPDQKFEDGMTLVPGYLDRAGYRLPTEAEWEYACRAGSTTARYFGETETLLGHYAWYTKNSEDRWMLPVGSLKPNDRGLFDMQGNVLEWCQDPALYYNKKAEWVGDLEYLRKIGNVRRRVLRGGSFLNSATIVRSALRTPLPAGLPYQQLRFPCGEDLPLISFTLLPPFLSKPPKAARDFFGGDRFVRIEIVSHETQSTGTGCDHQDV